MAQVDLPRLIAPDGLLAVRRHPLTAHIAARLRDRCGVVAGSRIVLGVSGGADSIALLLACRVLREREQSDRSFAVDPIACHVNHRLRGDAIDDQHFVEELCGVIDVPCVVREVDVPTGSGNLSAAARRVRYDALVSVAHERNESLVAVAHHADDQFETILMNLCRGAGLDGLSGMSWRTPRNDGVHLVRPLLDTRRSACKSLCAAAGVAWRDDPTNENADYARVRLRADVAPVLESLWPGTIERMAQTSDLLEYVADRLATDVNGLFGPSTRRSWSREALQPASSILIAAGLRRAVLAIQPQLADRLTRSHLLEAADAIRDDDRRPRTFDWPGGVKLTVTAREVSL